MVLMPAELLRKTSLVMKKMRIAEQHSKRAEDGIDMALDFSNKSSSVEFKKDKFGRQRIKFPEQDLFLFSTETHNSIPNQWKHMPMTSSL